MAPLKRMHRASARSRPAWFPRSEGRGSIEARSGAAGTPRWKTRFHVRKDVAPLKPHDGEARQLSRFHVRKDVAPLKRAHGAPVLSAARFPRSEGRGSIEASYHVSSAASPGVSTFGRTWLH